MRLICPNCAAQYEIDEALIPTGGRDVQCSNCGHTWFEDRASAEGAVADETGAVAAAERPRRRELDDATRRILREEAEREAQQRRRAAAARPEEQTEMGLEPASKGLADLPDRDPEAVQGRSAGVPKQDGAPETDQPQRQTDPDRARGAAVTAASSRGDLLPDIDQINSTLTATSERQGVRTEDATDAEASTTRPGSGFGTGFGLVLALTAIALLVYLMAPRIAVAVPSTESMLISYVEAVNGLRAQLDEWLISASQWIVSLTGD